jgi:hypothetical protein
MNKIEGSNNTSSASQGNKLNTMKELKKTMEMPIRKDGD